MSGASGAAPPAAGGATDTGAPGGATDSAALLAAVLAPRADPYADLPAFRAAWRAQAGPWPTPVDRAILGGALADRLGYAFAAGYDAALHRLVPTLRPEEAGSLCVTEEGGAHPRAIRTRLVRENGALRLHGAKRWATLAGDGDALFVAASAGWAGERYDLRLVRVPAGAPGLRLAPQPPTPFAPEVPHFAVELSGVEVADEDVLPGDGWTRWIKPFRTVEDAHVGAAAAAYLLRVARTSPWPDVLAARLAALVLAFREVAVADPDAPAVHVALGGAFAALESVVAAAPWDRTDVGVAERWRRDAPLLGVAGQARAARLEAAWRTFR